MSMKKMWVLCEDKKLHFTDRFFAEFPKLGGVAVINRTLCQADFPLYPIFSVAVFSGRVFGKEDARIGAFLRVKHEQGAE